jgi:hypothetical protein
MLEYKCRQLSTASSLTFHVKNNVNIHVQLFIFLYLTESTVDCVLRVVVLQLMLCSYREFFVNHIGYYRP